MDSIISIHQQIQYWFYWFSYGFYTSTDPILIILRFVFSHQQFQFQVFQRSTSTDATDPHVLDWAEWDQSQHIYKTSSLPAIKHENGWNIHVKYHPAGFSQLLKNDELLKTLGMSKLPKLYGTCARWCPELWLVYVASPWTIYIYMYTYIYHKP